MMKKEIKLLKEEDLINFDVYFPPFKYWSKNSLTDPLRLIELISNDKIKEGNIYIHFPFCPSQCQICPYFKFGNNLISEVSNLILKEIKLYGKISKKPKIRSILIGGGTPNFIPIKIFEKILITLKHNFKLDHLKQFAIEFRPGIKYKQHVKILLKYFKPDIIHVSLGLQSAYPEKIKIWKKPIIGKEILYSKEDVEEMIGFLHKEKIKNINIDFMVENTKAFMKEKDYIKILIKNFGINKISIYAVYSRFMGRDYFKEIPKWTFDEILDLRKKELKFFKSFNFKPLIWPIYFVKQGFEVNLESLTQFEGKTLFAIGPSARGTIRTAKNFFMYENSKNIEDYKKNILKKKFPISLLYEYPKNMKRIMSDDLRSIYINFKKGLSSDTISEMLRLSKLGGKENELKNLFTNFFIKKGNKRYLNKKGFYLIDAVYWALWSTIKRGYEKENERFIKINQSKN